MKVTIAVAADQAAFLELAKEVEHFFGPMADDPDFQTVVAKNIQRGSALCIRRVDGPGLLGGPQRKPRKASGGYGGMAEQLQEQAPELTRQEVADRLDISDRRLRTVAPRKKAAPKVAVATAA